MNSKQGLTLGIAFGIASLLGCGGDTDGGKAGDSGFQDNVFVSTSDTTGTIELVVNEDDMPVGETSGFHVYVKNADGRPVKAINVACDSEEGVAILEPTQGNELTDETGQMSGRIGCERRGSLQLVCRLTTGGNKRDFHTIKCRGDVPEGFQGFPGAAGGGIGGGVAIDNDGQVRITAIGLQDEGSSTTIDTSAAVDVVQGLCGTPPSTDDPEPFFDTYAAIKVENNLRERFRFSYLTYSVANANRRGQTFQSQRYGLTGLSSSTLDANGDAQTIVVPVFKAFGGGKYFGNSPSSGESGLEISPLLGLRTVTFTLVGQTSTGQTVSVSGDFTGSFSNFDQCD